MRANLLPGTFVLLAGCSVGDDDDDDDDDSTTAVATPSRRADSSGVAIGLW
jgi:hypothetical protein